MQPWDPPIRPCLALRPRALHLPFPAGVEFEAQTLLSPLDGPLSHFSWPTLCPRGLHTHMGWPSSGIRPREGSTRLPVSCSLPCSAKKPIHLTDAGGAPPLHLARISGLGSLELSPAGSPHPPPWGDTRRPLASGGGWGRVALGWRWSCNPPILCAPSLQGIRTGWARSKVACGSCCPQPGWPAGPTGADGWRVTCCTWRRWACRRRCRPAPGCCSSGPHRWVPAAADVRLCM